mmetsp:Transcript_32657/g.90104  ORF Transcript_32657/g.90104 Transcript_32657/m.90104 type:complete len:372 (-) Transcript_32657:180-1295(-)
MSLADAIRGGVKLRSVAAEEMWDRSSGADAARRGSEGDGADEEAKRREYFFSTGIDQWYTESLAAATFRSVAVPLAPEEARCIVTFWDAHVYRQDAQADGSRLVAGAERSPVELLGAPATLGPLAERIDAAMATLPEPSKGAFVKLSTRSPKDAKLALRAAGAEYQHRLADDVPDGAAAAAAPSGPEEANRRITLLCEVQTASLRVTSGADAVALFLDSERVAEDLKFALEAADQWNVTVSVREWCSEVKLHSEWRGFVWGGTLNALCQYYHPLHFPCLQEEGFAEQVGRECLSFFNETVAPVLKKAAMEHCIVDFAWLGPGRVLLVEINPFDGVLGAFPVSTGLFLWDKKEDRVVMQAGPFEVRVRRVGS